MACTTDASSGELTTASTWLGVPAASTAALVALNVAQNGPDRPLALGSLEGQVTQDLGGRGVLGGAEPLLSSAEVDLIVLHPNTEQTVGARHSAPFPFLAPAAATLSSLVPSPHLSSHPPGLTGNISITSSRFLRSSSSA